MKSAGQPIQFQRYTSAGWETVNSQVIREDSVSLTVNGNVWLTFMCSPTDLEALAIGFLFNEDLIHGMDEVADVRVCAAGDNVDVWLNHPLEKPAQWRRTSGCTGGVTSIERVAAPVLSAGIERISPDALLENMSSLLQSQEMYREARGVHCSALSDGETIRILAEDIGRHNTLDKIAGRLLMEKIILPRRIILTTGRISSEMLQKSARLDASVIMSRTSPTSLSIELAESMGITLIGYARRTSMQVYTHAERLQESPAWLRVAQPSELDR